MEMKQVSDTCFAALCEKNRVCDANSGLINRAGGVVIDTQSDLAHARQMIELFSKVWPAMPKRVVNTHEDGDHVWGNQLFEGAEIIAHRSVPERMKTVADPEETRKLLHGVDRFLTRLILKALHPGVAAVGQQLLEDYNLDGVELILPTTLFDTRYELDLDGMEVHLIYLGPCHQVGDTIVHVPSEGVVFAGDLIFRQCTPMGWVGSYEKWFQGLDLIMQLNPDVIVPGHGPICGIEGVADMKAYLQYIRDESKKCFDAGLTSLNAAKRIEFGPYGEWRAPARLYLNVERAYREFRNDPPDQPWDHASVFDAVYKVAKAKVIDVEY
jgi:glyoxylase-like metal-dependent hydrolase (beta-lactamase superfamily II)